MHWWKSLGMIAVTLAAALAMPGCGESESVRKIAVLVPGPTHKWTAGVNWWVEQTIEQYEKQDKPVQWIYQAAKDAAEQANQVDTVLNQGVDGIVILAFDSKGALGAVKKAKERGVFVVSVDRGLAEPVADIYLAGNNREFGRKSAEWMARRLDGEGQIVIFRGVPSNIDTERFEGAMQVFGKHDGIEVLAVQNADWNSEKAQQIMETWLKQFDEIDAVWASDDDMALGIEKAIRQAGREEEMWIFGGAGMQSVVKRIKEDDELILADITYPPGMIVAGMHLAYANVVLNGDEKAIADEIPDHLGVSEDDLLGPDEKRPEGQRDILLELKLITTDNADQFIIEGSPF